MRSASSRPASRPALSFALVQTARRLPARGTARTWRDGRERRAATPPSVLPRRAEERRLAGPRAGRRRAVWSSANESAGREAGRLEADRLLLHAEGRASIDREPATL